jgi:CelD/BcsL family acetyltransferase involved in cellulose biosynthesis
VSGFAHYDHCAPRVLVFEELSGRWAGVLPLCERPSLLPGVRQLELIGGRLSDYPGMLAEPTRLTACERAASRWLTRLSGQPAAVIRSQQHVPPHWLPALPCRVVAQEETVSVPLPASVEQYMQSLSAKYRSNLRRYQRLLGSARVEFRTPENERDLRAAMPVLFQLHQDRKCSQGERGRFYEPRWREAFTEIAVALQARVITRLTVMYINDTPAAASFDLRLHGTQFTYQYGMNPQLRSFSPGKLLTLRMLEDAINAGMRRYDFGRGLEEYKLQWSKERRELSDLIMARNSAILGAWLLTHKGYARLQRSRLLKRAYLTLRGREQPSAPGRDAGAEEYPR